MEAESAELVGEVPYREHAGQALEVPLRVRPGGEGTGLNQERVWAEEADCFERGDSAPRVGTEAGVTVVVHLVTPA